MENQQTVRQWLEKQEGVSFRDMGSFNCLVISKTVEKSLCVWNAESTCRMDESFLQGNKFGAAMLAYGGMRQAMESLLLEAIKADQDKHVTGDRGTATITITRVWRSPRECLLRYGVEITPSSDGYVRLTISYNAVQVFYDYPENLLDIRTARALMTTACMYQEGIDLAKRLAGVESLWKVKEE